MVLKKINIAIFRLRYRVFIALVIGSIEVGRITAFSSELSSGKVASARLLTLFDRESKINPLSTKGKVPVSEHVLHKSESYVIQSSLVLGLFSKRISYNNQLKAQSSTMYLSLLQVANNFLNHN